MVFGGSPESFRSRSGSCLAQISRSTGSHSRIASNTANRCSRVIPEGVYRGLPRPNRTSASGSFTPSHRETHSNLTVSSDAPTRPAGLWPGSVSGAYPPISDATRRSFSMSNAPPIRTASISRFTWSTFTLRNGEVIDVSRGGDFRSVCNLRSLPMIILRARATALRRNNYRARQLYNPMGHTSRWNMV